MFLSAPPILALNNTASFTTIFFLLIAILLAFIALLIIGTRILKSVKNTEKVNENVTEHYKLVLSITSSMSEGMYALDKNGLLIFMNSEAEHMLGWKQDELIGKNIHDFILPEVLPHTLTNDFRDVSSAAAQYNNFTIQTEETFTNKSGAKLAVSVLSSRRKTGDETSGTVIIFRNIDKEINTKNNILIHASNCSVLPVFYFSSSLTGTGHYSTNSARKKKFSHPA